MRKFREREQVDPNREGNSIVVTNFTGLNTTSNPMTIPYEDSPVFTNVIVGERGGVERRKGTKVLYEPQNSNGSVLIPVSTGYGYNFIVVKEGTSLNVLELSGDTVSTAFSKTNVWSNAARDVKPSHVTLTEPSVTNVLLCTGTNAPVQLRLEEFRAAISLGSASNTITIPDATRIRNHLQSNVRLYVDGTLRTVTAWSYNGVTNTTQVTVSGTPLAVGTRIVDCVFCTWQWWAESYYYYGDRFYDTVNRSHAKPTDVHVAIPENLRDELEPLLPTYPFLYPIDVLYWTGTSQQYGSPVVNLKPTTAYQYTFSDGAQRLDTAAPATFAKSYVTFGAVDSTKASLTETVYLLRRRKLKFRGGLSGIFPINLFVTVDGVVKQQRTIGSSANDNGDYLLFASASSFTPVTVGTNTPVDYISFGGGNPVGVPTDSIVRLTNTQPIYNGTNATPTNTVYVDGGWVPCYGLGQFSDYSSFSFPRICEIIQQRLVFSGFPHNPLQVCMSSVSDTNTPSEYFRFFQQDAFTDKATDPIDFVVSSSSADDYVTGLIEHQGSLFVGTSKNTYRVSATGRAPLEPGNYFVSNVGSVGPLNPDCVAKTSVNTVMLTQQGLYSIENGTNAQEATEYNLQEVSIAIHSVFKDQPGHLQKVAWIGYNSIDDALFVGLASDRSTQVATRLFRYGVFRNSWSEYTTIGGWNSYSAVTLKNTAGANRFVYCCARTVAQNGSASNITLLTDTDRIYLDYVRTAIGTGNPVTISYTPVPETTHTIVRDARYYSIGFDTVPINDVYDLQVIVGGYTCKPVQDYEKVGDRIYLHYGEPGETLLIRYYNPSVVFGRHYMVYVDNVRQDNIITTFPTVLGSVINWGTTYQSVVSTPLLTWGTLFGNKRVMTWAGLFDNSPVIGRWGLTDRNTTSNQPVGDIVDFLKNVADCNISFVYDSDNRTTSSSSDLYNFNDALYFDVGGNFDTDAPMQTEPEVLIKQSLQGVGYSFRCMVWECGDAFFSLLSYQIEARQKGKKNRHWSE